MMIVPPDVITTIARLAELDTRDLEEVHDDLVAAGPGLASEVVALLLAGADEEAAAAPIAHHYEVIASDESHRLLDGVVTVADLLDRLDGTRTVACRQYVTVPASRAAGLAALTPAPARQPVEAPPTAHEAARALWGALGREIAPLWQRAIASLRMIEGT